MANRRRCLYVACEEFDFLWEEQDVKLFRQLWQEGVPIHDMPFDRDLDEIAFLAIDLVRKGDIQKRDGGAWGHAGRAAYD